jgi:hypothetical protein
MQKRLTHQVKVKEFDLSCKAVGEGVEFLHGKGVRHAFRAVAKGALQVAEVANL